MHILIIVENLPVPFDRRVWNEALTLRDAGYQVSIICPLSPDCPKVFEELEGIKIYRHHLPAEGPQFSSFIYEYIVALFHQLRLAIKIYRERPFNAIQGCNPPDLIWLVALPFKLFGVKYIFDHHDINPELFEAKFSRRGIFWCLLRVAEWCSFKVADITLATNESYKEIAITRGGKEPEKVFIVRSAPDLSRIIRCKENLAWKAGRRFLIGYVGVIGEQEGLELLIEALRLVVRGKQGYSVQLVVVGDGPHLPAIKELAAKLSVSENITFTGRVDDATLFEVLETCDICVNPDRVNPMNDKSTMNKIMEYMAFGKPIVQFDVTEGRRSAQGASLYAKANDPVDFADKLVQLISDASLREQMGLIGHKRLVNELAWEFSVPHLLAAYTHLLPAPGTPGEVGER